MIHLRPGRDDDKPAYIALIANAYAEYPGCVFDLDGELPELHALATWFDEHGGRLWVAEYEGTVVGMLGIAPTPEAGTFEVKKVYVSRDHRGRGIAGRLLAEGERAAWDLGARRLILWSDTRFETAHRFYRNKGYTQTGATRELHDLSASVEFFFEKRLAG